MALSTQNPRQTAEKLRGNLCPMLDVCTSHVTESDSGILNHLAANEGRTTATPLCPRIVATQYGWVVFVCSEPEDVATRCKAMRKRGLSAAFIAIYKAAASLGVTLLNLDGDAAEAKGLPTFEW